MVLSCVAREHVVLLFWLCAVRSFSEPLLSCRHAALLNLTMRAACHWHSVLCFVAVVQIVYLSLGARCEAWFCCGDGSVGSHSTHLIVQASCHWWLLLYCVIHRRFCLLPFLRAAFHERSPKKHACMSSSGHEIVCSRSVNYILHSVLQMSGLMLCFVVHSYTSDLTSLMHSISWQASGCEFCSQCTVRVASINGVLFQAVAS
jgi:hypothetical protein